MFQHTLLLAYRSFLRFKSTFFINLIGLSTGLAGALLIYLWVSDELAVDKFHEKDSRLFQVMQNYKEGADDILTLEETPGSLAEALSEEMPEVEYAVSTVQPFGKKGFVSVGENHIEATELCAGKDFFNVFSYTLIRGNKDQVLTDKNAVVISEELALKLFGTTKNIIGRTIEWNRKDFNEWVPKDFNGSYLITGVFAKPPANSTAQFDLVFTYELYLEKYPEVKEWFYSSNLPKVYVILKEGIHRNQFNAKIAGFLKSKHKESNGALFIRQYSDGYLYGHYENGVPTGGRIEYVRLFSMIALFILVIACINFMNLSTAKASRRMKEVGIKKAMGANRKVLIFQFLGESVLMTLLSLIIAIWLVMLLLPQFNEITGKRLFIDFNLNLILSFLGIALFTGLISGSYPALYLSGFKPALILKGTFNSLAGELWVRKGLVVFQFTLSIILVVSVVIVYKQIELVQTKNLGYNRDNVIFFQKGGKVAGNPETDMETFLRELKNIPGVVNAANLGFDISGSNGTTDAIFWQGKSPEDKTQFHTLHVGYNLIETLGYEIIAGRTYSRDLDAGRHRIIFNETAIKMMGITNPVGKSIKWGSTEYEIIGVVKDFNFETLYEKVKPCFFSLLPKYRNIVVKISAGTERETLSQLHAFYKQYVGLSLDYRFLDQDYQALYAAEQRVATLSKYFGALAIIISCLGLFGLAAFTAERRRKEIGVRKVLGASRLNIVYLLSGDFTKLVIVSICISLPLSYLIVKYWLNNFEYRIALEWWYFIGAGLVALVIAWLTVSAQAVKAARVNPVYSLKDE